MQMPSLVAFADIGFLAAFMLWIAAEQSQASIEDVDLPVALVAVAPSFDLGPDAQVLNIRWLEGDKFTPKTIAKYEAVGMGDWTTGEYSFAEVTWEGQILMPAPAKWFTSTVGCADLQVAVFRTAETWPRHAPVLIRADYLTPFARILKIADVFNRYSLQDHPVSLAVADGRE